ncbi:MAG TPA: EthD domain-containing protein [Steroidobacteraceae bacterium]|nr:EthD domain-containing protein [Steroidobacteraceae bacterium]
MQRLMVLLKRKPGMTQEAFRRHYEDVHAALGTQFFGGLMVAFRRYYPTELKPFPSDWGSLASTAPDPGAFDAITVYSFRDEAARREYLRRMNDPAIASVLMRDEERFLDRAACRVGFCDGEEGDGIRNDREP